MNCSLDEYRRHAAQHGSHTAAGGADAINKSCDGLHQVLALLTRSGKRHELLSLFDDPDPAVQCWAAAHTLEFDEERALAKLADLARLEMPHVSVDAEHTIKEWESGQLRFPLS